jgi:hypothetical protein
VGDDPDIPGTVQRHGAGSGGPPCGLGRHRSTT